MQSELLAFAKILVCVDGSESSAKAADHAIEMAKKHDAQLIALNVVVSPLGYAYSPGAFGFRATPSAISEILQAAKNEARKWLDQIGNKAAAQGVRFRAEIVESPTSTVAAIVDYAETNKIDLIVTGTKGRSGFKKLLLGSVASGVATYASCPVMIAK
jgi:nucleotide-binding universal stress UspA family protein